MSSLLKTRVFTNPAGELVNMSHRENQCAEYDIFIIWNFPQGFGFKVKIGRYFPYFPQRQQLHISEDVEWATGGTLVCTPQILNVFKISILLNIRHWNNISVVKTSDYSCKRPCSVTRTKICSTPCKYFHRDQKPLNSMFSCTHKPIHHTL